MDIKEHLFYGLGIIAFAIAEADGKVQAAESTELHEMIKSWADEVDSDFDITEIIFSVMSKTQPGLDQNFGEGMKHISMASDYLDERLKEKFIYLIEDIAHVFPPVTHTEEDMVRQFKAGLKTL